MRLETPARVLREISQLKATMVIPIPAEIWGMKGKTMRVPMSITNRPRKIMNIICKLTPRKASKRPGEGGV
jgi:hypothetical protein